MTILVSQVIQNYVGQTTIFVILTLGSCDMQRQIMVIPLTFCHSDTIVSNGTQRQIMVIPLTFSHPDTIVSNGTQRQIMVILRLLSSRGGGPDDMREPFGPTPFYLFSSKGGGPDDMREPFGPALFYLLSSKGSGPDGMRGTISSRTFFHYPKIIKSDSARRQIMVISAFRRSRGTNLTASGWCVGTDHFQIFAGSTGREIHWPNGVSLERN